MALIDPRDKGPRAPQDTGRGGGPTKPDRNPAPSPPRGGGGGQGGGTFPSFPNKLGGGGGGRGPRPGGGAPVGPGPGRGGRRRGPVRRPRPRRPFRQGGGMGQQGPGPQFGPGGPPPYYGATNQDQIGAFDAEPIYPEGDGGMGRLLDLVDKAGDFPDRDLRLPTRIWLRTCRAKAAGWATRWASRVPLLECTR